MDVGALLVISREQLRTILTQCLLPPGVQGMLGSDMDALTSRERNVKFIKEKLKYANISTLALVRCTA